jgi:hypothetical protein
MKLNDIITEGKGKSQKPKPFNIKRNPVAKNIEKFNRPVTHKDKKKELKKKGPEFKKHDIFGDMDEGTFVSAKADIIDSILRQIKDKALNDDTLVKQLASLINSTANPRRPGKPKGNWNLISRDNKEKDTLPMPSMGPMPRAVNEEANPEQIQAQIAQLQPLADKLEYGPQAARDITKQIKYADTHMTIINELGALAEKLGLNEKELDYYTNQVFDAKNNLESAVYETEEFFDDKYKEVAYKIEELEMDLQDLEYEKNREQ